MVEINGQNFEPLALLNSIFPPESFQLPLLQFLSYLPVSDNSLLYHHNKDSDMLW